jgi:hypothetical protein
MERVTAVLPDISVVTVLQMLQKLAGRQAFHLAVPFHFLVELFVHLVHISHPYRPIHIDAQTPLYAPQAFRISISHNRLLTTRNRHHQLAFLTPGKYPLSAFIRN